MKAWEFWGLMGCVGGVAYGCGALGGASFNAGDSIAPLPAPANEDSDPDDPSSGPGGALNTPIFYPTNPFVRVTHDPLSTFAADVDTASYDLYRSYVDTSTLPPPKQVRLEEFVNYFDYDYPPPDPKLEEPFAIHLEAGANLVSRDTTILRVAVQGKVIPRDQKKPANIVFLADVSGSMEGSLPLVKEVMRGTLGVLDPTDTVALVTYAGSFATPLEATKVSEKATITRAIDALEANGGTNGEGGILAAYAQAESVFIEGGINHIVILTDGDFNIGLSSTQDLENLVIEKRKGGITLTVLGFGYGNTNDEMMERISLSGNGIYGYIGDRDDAEKYVSERMIQSLQHIAKDIKLQVEFNPEHVYAYRLLGYEDRDIADQDFRNDVVDAGEIGSGHRVTALYELVFREGELPVGTDAPTLEDGAPFSGAAEVQAEDLVLVKLRYKLPGATEADPAREVSTSLAASSVAEGSAGTSSDFAWALAVASYAEVLKESPYARPEKLDAMALIFDAQATEDPERAEFTALFHKARGLLR
jgi:Ca-activated chloride channel homolog